MHCWSRCVAVSSLLLLSGLSIERQVTRLRKVVVQKADVSTSNRLPTNNPETELITGFHCWRKKVRSAAASVVLGSFARGSLLRTARSVLPTCL
ncbi:hypothetical protein B0H66DRAFT_386179 [Apodospora peruviana]|uniref:Secreted protein n=1 Tax=Apodospora peruviana TaxID=516989 RepID=A0AAE0LZZ5_9PEZI|nr:hypothetical protein B0H66DRAFT_386179 [Apodospora peruviana]